MRCNLGRLVCWLLFVLDMKLSPLNYLSTEISVRKLIANGFGACVRRAYEASCVYTDKRLFKDTCLLVSRKKMSAKRPLKLRANDDRVRPLTFICCYTLPFVVWYINSQSCAVTIIGIFVQGKFSCRALSTAFLNKS